VRKDIGDRPSAYFLLGLTAGLLLMLVVLALSPRETDGQKTAEQAQTHAACEQFQNRPEEGGFWEKTRSDPVSFFTAWLVVFTAVLAVVSFVQIYFLNRTDETARISANSAKTSADSLINLERPRLFVRHTTTNIDPNGALFCDYSVENYRKSPAIMVEQCVDLRCVSQLPAIPQYVHIVPSRRVLHSGEENDKFRAELSQTEQRHNAPQNDNLYLLGYFVFKDVFGAVITTGFCYKLDRLTGRLIEEGGTAFNYDHRKEQKT
jgi:hypothetical protein